MERKYWAHFTVGNKKHRIGPYPTRLQAEQAVPENAKKVSTGYGAGGAWFDIQYHTPMKMFTR